MHTEILIKLILEKYINDYTNENIYNHFYKIYENSAEDMFINFIFDIEDEFDIYINEEELMLTNNLNTLIQLIETKKGY